MDNELFHQACNYVLNQKQSSDGIGTLREKTIHSVLKYYLSPKLENQEVKVGKFVADIYDGERIYEIQTRDFSRLRRKLQSYLEFSPVTIVYPIPHYKYLRWINPETGEISPPRKSPKTGKPYDIFPELYKIKSYLTDPNLSIRIILMDMEEYRYLDGWSKDLKKGSTRCDRIPLNLIKEIHINDLSDYQKLIPDKLDETFTTKDLKVAAAIRQPISQVTMNILYHVGAVDRIGKKSHLYLYTRT
ncbi:MAG: hypothetical protein GX288_02240 [Clostridiales bacterium]|nr:hypothetical protein [Clostridiales bacterium]